MQKERYNYKKGAENESKEQERLRLDVQRGAKRRCFDKFNPEKMAAKRASRTGKAREKKARTNPPSHPPPTHSRAGCGSGAG